MTVDIEPPYVTDFNGYDSYEHDVIVSRSRYINDMTMPVHGGLGREVVEDYQLYSSLSGTSFSSVDVD